MTATSADYRYVGPHLDDLHDGRIVEPGQLVTLTHEQATDPHNQQRIQTGLLVLAAADRAAAAAEENATDEAIELAAANGVTLADVQGSGANSRILKGDVEQYIRDQEEHAS